MKYFTLFGVVIVGLSFNLAHAQEIRRYDRAIEAAAAKRAGEKVGTLRGIILADRKNLFVLRSDLMPVREKETKFTPPQQTLTLPATNRQKTLPPIVMKNTVDPIVTGQPYAPNKRYLKFDSNGDPLKHHQEYPRPTLKSVARSLIAAMDMNIYPGSD